jgi:hypothetical protein
MALKILCDSIGQHSNSIFKTLAVDNSYLALTEIDIFHAESNALHQAQSATVEKPGHEGIFSRHTAYQALDFFPGEDNRQSFWALGPYGVDGGI